MTRWIALLTMLLTLSLQVSAVAQALSNPDPRFETRITVSYQNSPASHVLASLLKGGYLRGVLTTSPLRPVTLTLTNVRLRTALDVVCENAGCEWSFDASSGIVSVVPASGELPSIPTTVTIVLTRTPLITAFRAFAAAMGVTLVLETEVPEKTANFDLKNASAAGTLRLLSDLCSCETQLDEQDRTLRVSARP